MSDAVKVKRRMAETTPPPSDVYEGDEGVVTKNTDTNKCPNCGDNLVFVPDLGVLKCPSCGSKFSIACKPGEEIDFSKMESEDSWADETHLFHCNNCNAVTVLSKREIATICPFCGSPNVVESSDVSKSRPNAVLPFAFGAPKAVEIASKWAKKKLFAPSDYKKSFTVEKMKGVYLPLYTFDTQTYTYYQGRLGKRYTRTVRRNGRTETITETRFFPISGNIDYFFDDITVNSTDAIADKAMAKIMPFDTKSSVEYSENYLFGFSAELSSRSGKDNWNSAQGCAKREIERRILNQYTYDVVDYIKTNISYDKITYKYVLVPIYIGNYSYNKKTYSFYINGRNNRTYGTYPLSPIRVSVAVAIVVIILALVVFLMIYLGYMYD